MAESTAKRQHASATPIASGRSAAAQPAEHSVDARAAAGNQAFSRALATTGAHYRLGAPDDPAEREADAIARRVAAPPQNVSVSAVSAASRRPTTSSIAPTPSIRSSSASGSLPSGFAERLLAAGDGDRAASVVPSPLQRAFGAQLEGARLHAGPSAAGLARDIDAAAFTVGRDVYLGDSLRRPASAWQQHVLSHELAHTVQASRAPAGDARVVRRFVGAEHRELGDTTVATIDLGGGVRLSWGQVVALAGDEYGTFDELRDAMATADGRARLAAALDHDGVGPAHSGTLPAPTPDQRAAQETTFQMLALENVAHFADDGHSTDAWGREHLIAVDTALRAGLANTGDLNAAYFREAFGQHFLTDSFSAGHVRVPRSEIIEWYTTTWAPRVVGHLLAELQRRLVDALVAEANPQTSWPEAVVRMRVESRVQETLDRAIAGIPGGRPGLTRFLGLGIAGVISGTLHDADSANGVLVSSDAHPIPWRAFGDGLLADPRNATNREQAVLAVAAAKADVDQAYRIGEQETAFRERALDTRPERVHFRFGSAALEGTFALIATTAAAHLVYHPEANVEIVGHTDPVGPDGYNATLGLQRAQAVERMLLAAGVPPTQLAVRSEGETNPVTRDPRQFRLNRRAELHWGVSGSSPLASPTDLAQQRALDRVQREVGPPFTRVLCYVPRPVEDRGQSGNAPLPTWQWGTLDATTRSLVDDWVRAQVGTPLTNLVHTTPELNPITTDGITVTPRIPAETIVRDLLAHPTDEIGALAGERAGP